MKRRILIFSFAVAMLLLNGCKQNVQNNANGTLEISEEEAIKIALEKIPEATTENIQEFKQDYDNGKLKYEGKIYHEQMEYEFEIDGYTGTILEWDMEPINNRVS